MSHGLKIDHVIHYEYMVGLTYSFRKQTSWGFVSDGPSIPYPSNPADFNLQKNRLEIRGSILLLLFLLESKDEKYWKPRNLKFEFRASHGPPKQAFFSTMSNKRRLQVRSFDLF